MAKTIEKPSELARAVFLASRLHLHHVDLSGEPYILHPVRLVEAARGLGLDETTQVTCALHDVMEDAGVTYGQVANGFGAAVAHAVDACSRRKYPDGSKEPYLAFIKRAAAHPVARHVKRLDLLDHLSRPEAPDEKTRAYIAKRSHEYAAGLEILEVACLKAEFPTGLEGDA